jgi:hypothetical protein
MEQFNHHTMTGDSPNGTTGVVPFDVLRAMISARQAASPTARMLAGPNKNSNAAPSGGTAESLISLFARGDASAAPGSFARDEAVIRQDERHA